MMCTTDRDQKRSPHPAAAPKSAEPKQYFDQYGRSYEQIPPQGFASRTGHYEPLHSAAVVPPLIPSSQHKPEVLPSSTKPLPPPPALTEEDEDPAMKPQSVLTRVKMFENKRSASLENKKEVNDTASFKPPEASKLPGAPVTGPKSTPQSQFSEHDKTLYRIPEPQKPQMKPPEDIVRSNHYDPEEDEEYYRKQLSYFDRRSFENKPAAHIPASHLSEPAKPAHSQNQPNFSSYSSKGKAEADALDRSFGEKRYEPVQPTPPLPHCPRSTRRRPSLAPALLSTCTRRGYMVKVIQCHWIFRILWYPNQTHLHLRVSQQLSEHRTETMPLSLLYIPRKASRRKPPLMELNRLRKPSLQPTTDSHQNHIPVLPGHSSANLKVLSSTTIFCQVTLYINLTCLQKPQLLQKLL